MHAAAPMQSTKTQRGHPQPRLRLCTADQQPSSESAVQPMTLNSQRLVTSTSHPDPGRVADHFSPTIIALLLALYLLYNYFHTLLLSLSYTPIPIISRLSFIMSFIRYVYAGVQGRFELSGVDRLIVCISGVYSMFLVCASSLLRKDKANNNVQLWAIAQERRTPYPPLKWPPSDPLCPF